VIFLHYKFLLGASILITCPGPQKTGR